MHSRVRSRTCASVAVWLDRWEVQDLFALLVTQDLNGAAALLADIFGRVPEGMDLTCAAWREALLEELAHRAHVRVEADEQERIHTAELPDLEAFAPDRRAPDTAEVCAC